MKNILAAIGLLVIIQKGYSFYCTHQTLKKENDELRRRTTNNAT